MARLLLYIVFILVLYSVLRFLIKDISSLMKRRDRESESEELIRDPYCQAYIPKRSALKKRIAGRDYYFCNPKCLKRFLEKDTRPP